MAVLLAFAFALLVLGGIFGLVALVMWLAFRQQQLRDRVWGGVAQQLGMSYSAGRICGRRYGQPVQLAVVVRGSGKSQQSFTVASSLLETPLDLGLSVRGHGFFEDLFRGGGDIVVGDPVFDGRFLVQADEEHRARAALSPKLRQLLREQLAAGAAFSLSDSGFVVECRGVSTHGPWLYWAVDLAARASSELEQGRALIPVATPLAPYAQAWASYARARGLRGLDTPLCMWGSLEGVPVRAYAVRTGRLSYALEVYVGFAQSLGLGLQLRPQHTFDRLASLFGAQDIDLGDPPFDQAFVVKAHQPSAAGEIFDPPTRAALLALHQRVGVVSLSDEGMSVRLPGVSLDPAVVPRTVQQLSALAESISRRGPRERELGPYR